MNPQGCSQICTEKGSLEAVVKESLGSSSPLAGMRRVLEALQSQREMSVLLAVDQIDTLGAATEYRDAQSNPIGADQLWVVEEIGRLFRSPPGNFHLIGATDQTDPRLRRSSLKEPTTFIANAERYKVNLLSLSESRAILQHYQACGHLYRGSPGESVKERMAQLLHFVSGGSGSRLFRACNYENLYVQGHYQSNSI